MAEEHKARIFLREMILKADDDTIEKMLNEADVVIVSPPHTGTYHRGMMKRTDGHVVDLDLAGIVEIHMHKVPKPPIHPATVKAGAPVLAEATEDDGKDDDAAEDAAEDISRDSFGDY